MTPPPLAGVEIRVSPALAGQKHALRFGDGPIYVSPAMYDLIRHADPDELRRLLEAIHVRNLPPLPDFRGPLPMTTRRPE